MDAVEGKAPKAQEIVQGAGPGFVGSVRFVAQGVLDVVEGKAPEAQEIVQGAGPGMHIGTAEACRVVSFSGVEAGMVLRPGRCAGRCAGRAPEHPRLSPGLGAAS